MDWVPIVFVTFKIAALCTAMFFAVKWHYDQEEKGDWRTMLLTGGKLAASFVLALLSVVALAFFLSRMLGLDLGF